MKTTKKLATKPKYKLTITLGGEVYKIQTDDIKEAILSLKPQKITNTVIIKAERGKKSVEKKVFVFLARRIFNNPLAAQFFAKSLTLILQ